MVMVMLMLMLMLVLMLMLMLMLVLVLVLVLMLVCEARFRGWRGYTLVSFSVHCKNQMQQENAVKSKARISFTGLDLVEEAADAL